MGEPVPPVGPVRLSSEVYPPTKRSRIDCSQGFKSISLRVTKLLTSEATFSDEFKYFCQLIKKVAFELRMVFKMCLLKNGNFERRNLQMSRLKSLIFVFFCRS